MARAESALPAKLPPRIGPPLASVRPAQPRAMPSCGASNRRLRRSRTRAGRPAPVCHLSGRSTNESMRIGYLIGQYPAINHQYIVTEVTQLRALGISVFTCSVADPDRPPARLSASEQKEAASTYYVKRSWMT